MTQEQAAKSALRNPGAGLGGAAALPRQRGATAEDKRQSRGPRKAAKRFCGEF